MNIWMFSLILQDITIGTTISTRYHTSKWRDILGNFINDVAMRFNFDMYNMKRESILELLLRVRTEHSSVMERTSFPVCIFPLFNPFFFSFFFFYFLFVLFPFLLRLVVFI